MRLCAQDKHDLHYDLPVLDGMLTACLWARPFKASFCSYWQSYKWLHEVTHRSFPAASLAQAAHLAFICRTTLPCSRANWCEPLLLFYVQMKERSILWSFMHRPLSMPTCHPKIRNSCMGGLLVDSWIRLDWSARVHDWRNVSDVNLNIDKDWQQIQPWSWKQGYQSTSIFFRIGTIQASPHCWE